MRTLLISFLFASGLLAPYANADVTTEGITFRYQYNSSVIQGPAYAMIVHDGGVRTWNFPSGYSNAVSTTHLEVVPGKEYVITLTGLNTQASYGFFVGAPQGYDIYITGADDSDFLERSSIDATMLNYADTYKYKLIRSDLAKGPVDSRFGSAESWHYDRPIWEVNLGSLPNGGFAGVLGIKKDSVSDLGSGSNLSPSNLLYEGYSSEVEVIKSGGNIRQIFAPAGVADVVTHNSSSFSVRMFDWSNVGSKSGSVYTLYGSPVVTYKFTRSSSSTVDLEKTIGSSNWTCRLIDTGSNVTFYDWTKSVSPSENASLRKVITSVGSGNPEVRTTTEYGKNGSSFVASSKTVRLYETFSPSSSTNKWGPELVQVIEDPDGSALTTIYEYYGTPSSGGLGDYKKLKKVTYPNAAEIEYDYYDDVAKFGKIKTKKEPFGDTLADKITTYQYTTSGTGGEYLLSSEVTKISDDDFGKTVINYTLPSSSNLRKATVENYYEPDKALTTKTWTYREDATPAYLRGLPHSVVNPDNSKIFYRYYLSGTNLVTEVYNGFSAAPSGVSSASLAVASGPGSEKLYVVPNQSTMQKSVVSASGLLLQSSNHVCFAGSSYETIGTTYYSYDASSRLDNVSEGSSTVYEAGYFLGMLDWSVDGAGLEKTYAYDDLGRLTTEIELGQAVTSAGQTGYATNEIKSIKRSYEYDGSHRMTEVQLIDMTSSSAAAPIISSFEYDLAGRLTVKTADCCDVVGYFYGTFSEEQNPKFTESTTKTTQVNADGGTVITERFKDGDLKSRTGTATIPLYVVKKKQPSVDQLSIAKARHAMANVGDYTQEGWTLERLDWLGRLRSTKHRNDGGYSVSDSTVTNVLGSETITEYEFDQANGRLVARYTRSVVGDDDYDYIAPYRYEYNGIGQLWLEGMDVDGSGLAESSASDRITKNEAYLSKISGQWWAVNKVHAYPTANTPRLLKEDRVRLTHVSGELGKAVSIDSQGNVTTRTSKTYRPYGVVVDESQFDPAGSGSPFNKSVSVSKLGLPVYGLSPSGETTSIEYDALRRQHAVNGRDQVRSRYAYKSGSRRVEQVYQEQSGGSTSVLVFQYDYTHGKLTTETRKNNASGGDEVTSYSYTPLGNVEKVWGSGANPVKFVYDSYGRKIKQIQYRDVIDGSAPSIVEWAYAPSTGVLRSKAHVNGATRNTEYYRYNELGSLEHRKTARGVSTDYLYSVKGVDPDGAGVASEIAAGVGTGELLAENHSDSTPDVSYSYDKMGRIAGVDDYLGERTFDYSAQNDLALWKETFDDDFYGTGADRDFVHSYETAGSGKVPGRFSGVAFTGASWMQGYDSNSGRINKFTAVDMRGVDSFSTVFNQTYVAGSNLPSVTRHGSYKQERVYETWRNKLAHSKTHTSTGVRSHYRVLERTQQGQLHRSQLDGSSTLNTSLLAYKLRSSSPSSSATIYYDVTYDKLGQVDEWQTSRDSSHDRDYNWDAAGNTKDYAGTSFEPDGFNQISPTSGASYGYDEDGDLTSDGIWTYKYDANNRLHRMTKSGKSLEFKYDYMGRRVEKKVWNSGPKSLITDSQWASGQSTHLKFAYQGMELVAEFKVESGVETIAKTFYWGLDKSGSRGGAGGAMGLIMWRDWEGQESYFPAYDLNGNVTGLLDSDHNWVAWYEYDAFGKVLNSSTGAMGSFNPIRFSSQYTDKETGLVYYGFRYYDPSKGRFLTRDPIGEAGGLNLHRFVGNDPVNRVDAFGLYWFKWCTGYETTMKWDSKSFGFKVQSTGRCGNWVSVWIPEGGSYASIPYKSGTQSTDGNPTDGNPAGGNPTGGNPTDGAPPPGQKDNDDKSLKLKLKCAAAKAALLQNKVIGHFLSETLGLGDNNLDVSYTGGLTVAPPVFGSGGVGVHGEVGVTGTLDWSDPLNFNFGSIGSVSGMITGGGGIFASAGPTFGYSEGKPKHGISETNLFVHIEGAGAVGYGGGGQVDIGLNESWNFGDPMGDLFDDSVSAQVSPRGVYGIGAFAGAGLGASKTATLGGFGDSLRDWYNENCN